MSDAEVLEAATPSDLGHQIDTVWVEIDYAILQHFSKHLYSSPNKAVEELVTNGYDALAGRVDVFLPGAATKESLLVWDDGTSMDVEELKQLWWIARSPKEQLGGERIATSADGLVQRKMVGKFGIGKLASYAVGNRLAHLCRRGDDFLLVRVDYNDAPRLGDTADEEEKGFATPVLKFDEAAARTFVESMFNEQPEDLGMLFSRTHWTLAIVDDIKEETTLTAGRLRWVLANGMPLRPDFEVWVDNVKVTPSALEGAFATLDLSAEDIRESISTHWENARQNYEVEGWPSFGCDVDISAGRASAERSWVDLPGLGRVYGKVLLFESSLRDGRAGEHGRSEGFFVFVRDRLLNPDDPKLLLNDPSFGAFNRMQITLWADGLDADLLADRERLQATSSSAAALKVLQHATYLAARSRIEKRDDEATEAGALVTLLPSDSREFYRQPLTALALSQQLADGTRLNAAKATIVQETAPEGQPLMSLRSASSELVLNQGHPLYVAAQRKLGGGQKAKEALRLVELFAVSDTLLAGHLIDIGVPEETVAQVMAWRDGQIRSLAVTFEKRPEEVVEEVEAASYEGGSRFENALAQLFRLMGFVAERDGQSGKKDVLVVAPVGRAENSFTAEGKGKRKGKGAKDKLANDESEISGAAAHAAAAGASFALVVARDFQGFATAGGDDEAAVLQECRCQTPPVTVITVESLVALFNAVQLHHYPLTTMVEALSVVESPADKLDRIRHLERPLQNFDTKAFLDAIWDLQQGQQSGMAIPIGQLKSLRPEWKAMANEAFKNVVYGLESATGGLVTFVGEEHAVELGQSPDMVMAALVSAPAPEQDSASSN